jgi:hypothetical protein
LLRNGEGSSCAGQVSNFDEDAYSVVAPSSSDFSDQLRDVEQEIEDVKKRRRAVGYCLLTSGSTLSTESPPGGGEDGDYWAHDWVYKSYRNEEALLNEKTALQDEILTLRNEKAELSKEETRLLQQRRQRTVTQSGSAVLSTQKKAQGENRDS